MKHLARAAQALLCRITLLAIDDTALLNHPEAATEAAPSANQHGTLSLLSYLSAVLQAAGDSSSVLVAFRLTAENVRGAELLERTPFCLGMPDGPSITAKVGKVGEPKPVAPQLDWVNPDPIAAGMLAFVSATFGGTTPVAARGDATFDVFVFEAIPEPAAASLMLVA